MSNRTSVSFSVQDNWYWSFSRLVLEYLIAGTAYETDLLFEDSKIPYSNYCKERLDYYNGSVVKHSFPQKSFPIFLAQRSRRSNHQNRS